MSENDTKAGPAPSRPYGLAFKTLAFLAALAASLLVAQAVYGLLGLPLRLGEMRLDAAGWITALMILMTTRPRGARHWGLLACSILAVVVAATLGAALGELLLQRGIVPAGGIVEVAVRIGTLLVLWGPALLVFARLLHGSGVVVEAWQPEHPEDARTDT
jgi:hypothetical protein